MNQFSDINPYESPVKAELARPEPPPKPPKRRKKWPPFFSIAFTVLGPFAFFLLCRLLVRGGLVDIRDESTQSAVMICFAVVWLFPALKSLIWFFRSNL